VGWSKRRRNCGFGEFRKSEIQKSVRIFKNRKYKNQNLNNNTNEFDNRDPKHTNSRVTGLNYPTISRNHTTKPTSSTTDPHFVQTTFFQTFFYSKFVEEIITDSSKHTSYYTIFFSIQSKLDYHYTSDCFFYLFSPKKSVSVKKCFRKFEYNF